VFRLSKGVANQADNDANIAGTFGDCKYFYENLFRKKTCGCGCMQSFGGTAVGRDVMLLQ
jgi:hypothetical protein